MSKFGEKGYFVKENTSLWTKTVPISHKISPIDENNNFFHKPVYPWYNVTTDKLFVLKKSYENKTTGT